MPIRGQTQFQSHVHMILYKAALRLTPPDISLAGMGDEAMAASARQFHAFMLAMLEDMYAAPDAYGLHAGELEAFLQGRAINAMKRRDPRKTDAHLQTARAAADRYQLFLYELGNLAAAHPGRAEITEADLDAVLAMGPVKKIPIQTRLAALERVGLRFARDGGRVSVTSERHPLMFPAMCRLAKVSRPARNFGAYNFCNCEFRRLAGRYVPTLEDCIRPLDDASRAIALRVDALAAQRGLLPFVNTYWKVHYRHKGQSILSLDCDSQPARPRGLVLCVRVDGGPRGWYEQAIENRGEAFRRYFLSHMNHCTGCSSSHLGAVDEVFGHRRRTCCAPRLSLCVPAPGEADLPFIGDFMDIRMEAVQSGL